MQEPGIKLVCPPEGRGTDPIPVQVRISADMRTYWDNNGLIGRALTVAVLRRDRPGVRLLAQVDPRAIMLSDTPLHGRPSDEELDSDNATVSEDKVLDARPWEEVGRGAAEYYVTGSFSKWWAGVRELRVTDPRNHIAPSEAPGRDRDGRAWKVRPRLADQEATIHAESANDGEYLAVPITAGLFAGPQWLPRGREQPWLSVVGFNLSTRGGVCGGDFAIEVGQSEGAADILLPLEALSLTPLEGHWLFLGVAGGLLVPPAEIRLGASHAG